jgi:hypothetical protein
LQGSTIDIIGQCFWFGILITPFLSYLTVRKSTSLGLGGKLIVGMAITFVLAFIFFVVAWAILFRNGLGPG